MRLHFVAVNKIIKSKIHHELSIEYKKCIEVDLYLMMIAFDNICNL